MVNTVTQSILVVGGGMSGITAAIEAAEAGHEVYLVEKNSYLGGRVAQLHQYFPKLCPPYCGLELNFRRIKNNGKIRFFTMAEVEKISGQEGNWDVKVKMNPRYVNEKCTGCGKCSEACTMEIDNPFNYGMDKIKAAYLPHVMAFPQRYVVDPALVKSPEAQKVKEACPYDAIELDMQPKTFDLNVGAIVWTTGWSPYDAKKLDTLGFGDLQECPDQRDDGAPRIERRTDPGQNRETLGRQGTANRCFCPVRRFPRRESPRFLFLHLLHGFHEAGDLCTGTVSGCKDLYILHRYSRHRSSGKLLREPQGRPEYRLLQGAKLRVSKKTPRRRILC